ncbi:PREDICTED: protein jim lovell [Ceratosolen solmsi marchali]|uniref:Protein jim lovell n=1 Tax=Ceratosolen solmsi marchali TaxID=326594 RepID=A0AAJ6VL81_9HYME|nr:PREDICTED: protein jim lovell [Ceratosolen solmsi marchali]
MSSVAESPDEMALQSHYSLRWNNHQTHILQAFEALLHAEILVDVTLVCAETSLRAHKVVLSVCSPFFERIFAEHPCKHPVIVLKDFPGREIAALIDFMYRGEVRVGREDLSGLMHAAESLQIRGLASSEPRPASPPSTPNTDLLMGEPSTPEGARQMLLDGPTPDEDDENVSEIVTRTATPLPILPRDLRPQAAQAAQAVGQTSFGLRELRETCGSPLMPRRKQARPRRRSGELVPQDLSRPHPPASLSPPSTGLNLSNNHQTPQQHQHQHHHQQQSQSQQQPQPSRSRTPSHQEDIAENLSMKREPKRSLSPATLNERLVKSESEAASSPRGSPLTGTSLHPDASFSDLPAAGLTAMSALALTPSHHHGSEYLTSLGQFAAQWLPPSQSGQSGQTRDGSPLGKPPGGFPYQQSESPLAPRSAFPMDGMAPLGAAASLFPHGGPLELHDSFKPESFHGLFVGQQHHHHPSKKPKKHRSDGLPRRWSEHARGLAVCRPKGQHSAPRGGPPRSWTNADLTEALTMVWNKKMTTSQASRVYGIPYNSLLMYVRGKYGKSLKLEQLRRDCTAGEVMNSLNNNVKPLEGPGLGIGHPGHGHPVHPSDAEANFAHHPLLSGGLAQGFFPDFGGFPVPVNMVHLLPPSEQKGFEAPGKPQGSNGPSNGHQSLRSEELLLGTRARSRSRSPSPIDVSTGTGLREALLPGAAQSAPPLLQQNGSD